MSLTLCLCDCLICALSCFFPTLSLLLHSKNAIVYIRCEHNLRIKHDQEITRKKILWSRCRYVDVVPTLWLSARVSLLQDGGTDSAGNSSSEALRRTPQHRQVTRNLPRPGEALTFTPKICVAPHYILEVEQGRLMGKLEGRRSGSFSCSV